MGCIDPKLDTALIGLLGTHELVEQWWNSGNKAFALHTPAYVYKRNPEYVISYIEKFSQSEGS